jgi:hypothetical protein
MLDAVPKLDEYKRTFKTMEFRDPKRYVVEKKFNGISVRLQCIDGVPEIHSINGESLTDMFPKLSDQLKTVTEGDFIADGIITFNLKEKTVPTYGKDFFKNYSHDMSYYIGWYNASKVNIPQTDEMDMMNESLSECVDVERPLFDSQILSDITEKGNEVDTVVDLLPERYARSFLRGFFEGSKMEMTDDSVTVSILDEKVANYAKRHLSSYYGKQFVYTCKQTGYIFSFTGKEAKEFVSFLYTAGPSMERTKLSAAKISDRPLCAHPDEDHAIMWIHDLLHHDSW